MIDREFLAFTGCDYLGLAYDNNQIEARQRACATSGLSVSASRTTTGTRPVHLGVESAMAEFLGTEASCLVSSGLDANIAACEGLAGLGATTAWVDPSVHPSLHLAARAAGLSPASRSDAAIWCVDGTQPALGTIAEVGRLLQSIGERRLLVDDCHGIGVVGPTGRGACEGHAHDQRVTITGTGSKALGTGGGFVAGEHSVIDAIRRKSVAYGCSTAVDEGTAAALLAAVTLLSHETCLRDRLWQIVGLLRDGLRRLGMQCHDGATPVYLVAGETQHRTQAIADHLLASGIYAPAVSYPGQPSGLAIRVSVNAMHTQTDIGLLLDALASALARLEMSR